MGERLRSLPLAWATALLVLLGAGCRKEPSDPQWDVDLAAPLLTASLTLGDLIPDSLLSADADGRVSVLYTAQLFSLALDTVLTAPDTSFRYTYALPFPGPVQFAPGTTFTTSDDVTEFDLEDLALRELRIRSGQVDVAITNMMAANIIGTFALPGASLNGTPFTIQQIVPPGSPAAPSTLTSTQALDGYFFDLRGPDHNTVNTLATALSYMNDTAGSSVSVTDQDSLIAVVSYRDIVPQYATGYFGTRLVEVAPASTTLDLFENVSGSLDLDQVTARLKVRNGIGVDARATIHYLRAVNTVTGHTVDLTHPITSSPINLDRALDLGNGFQPAQNSFTLTEANSNIDLFVENLPDRVDYALDVTIDPLGDVSNGHDFLYYESRITADLEVDIPLRLSATDLTLRKTTTVDLPGSTDGHALQSGTLLLFATNGFPFSAGIQLAVVDAEGNELAQLGPGGTLPSATVGADGLVTASASGRLDIELSAAQLDLLYSTDLVRITAVLNTAGQDHVQLLSSYRLDVQLTAEGNYLVNGDE